MPVDEILSLKPDAVVAGVVYAHAHGGGDGGGAGAAGVWLPTQRDEAALAQLAAGTRRFFWLGTPNLPTETGSAAEFRFQERNQAFTRRNAEMRRWAAATPGAHFLPFDALARAAQPLGRAYRQGGGHFMCGWGRGSADGSGNETVLLPLVDAAMTTPLAACRDDMVNLAIVQLVLNSLEVLGVPWFLQQQQQRS
jgi:hypothetical protein